MKNLDLKRAFDFIRSGENWSQKLLIGGFLYWLMNILNFFGVQNRHIHSGHQFFISNMILLAVLLIGIIPAGYLIQVSHNEINNNANSLPNWGNIKKFIRYQLSLSIPIIIYLIPVVLLVSLLSLFITILITKSFHLVTIFLTLIVSIIISLPILTILSLMLGLSYSENLKIEDCFKPLKIIRLFKNALPEFLMYFLASFIIYIPLYISAVLAPKNLLFSLVGFISFPVGIFFAHLSAQAYKYALSKEKDLALAPAETELIDSDNM